MASGTKGKLKALEIERIKKRIIARQKQNELAINREKAIELVCKYFGWSKLEPWAESKLNILFNGGTIDLKEFDSELAKWQAEQTVETETETVTEEVKEQCQN